MDNDYYEFIDDNVNLHSIFFDNISPHQEQDGLKQKANLKNTYIKKISNLISKKTQSQNPQTIEQLYKHYQSNKIQEQKTLDSDEVEEPQNKLVKNRESAKNSRKRKKMYVDLLENKVAQLTEKHENLKKICDSNHELTDQLRSKMVQKQTEGNQRILLVTHLQNAILSKAPEYNINCLLDQLTNKYGPVSQDRLTRIDHYIQEISENCLPNFMQYLMKISKRNKDIFEMNKSLQEEDYMILTKLKLTEKQKQIMEKQQTKLSFAFDQFKQVLGELKGTQQAITQELTDFDGTLSQLQGDILPSQMAKFVLDIEQKDQQNQFRVSFNEYFGDKLEDQAVETPFDQYDFMKEYRMNDPLDIEAHACFSLYHKSQEFIKSRKNNAISQLQMNDQ